MAVIVRPLPVCVVAWPESCRCGDLLKPGEQLCAFCTSQDEAEARWADADAALAARPCQGCGGPVGDPDPDERFCSESCYVAACIGVE